MTKCVVSLSPLMHNTIYVSSASIWQPWMLSALPAYGSHEVKGLHPQDLPFSALSLSRRVLDEALLVRAQDQGARVWRGAAVTALIKGPECWHIEVAGHGVIQAETIFLATGKHDLREMATAPWDAE